MAAISFEKYVNLMNFYSQAIEQVVGVTNYYYDAALEVLLVQSFDPELDLLAPFHSAYTSSRTFYSQPPSTIVTAVQSLQRHILAKARTNADTRYTDINDWLDASNTYGANAAETATGRLNDVDTSTQVPTNFATLSAQAGYVIDDALISASVTV